ncbi:hypothetical protein D3C81_1804700 [compost metagenome]
MHPNFLVFKLVTIEDKQDAAIVVLHAFVDKSKNLVDGQFRMLPLDVVDNNKTAFEHVGHCQKG